MIALWIICPIVIIVCTWLLLIAPVNEKSMDYYKTVKYAHRGLHGKVDADSFAAENSLTAFSRAVEHGFGIELDVRLTKDKEVVVFHDDTLDRVTNGTGRVENYTLEELKKLSLMDTEDTIPTLSEVLSLVGGRVPLLVEIKEGGADRSVSEKSAELLKEYEGKFIVESFNPLSLGTFKKALPDVPRGFLNDKHTEKADNRSITYRLIQRFLLNFIARPSFIAMNRKRAEMFPLPIIKKIFGTPTVAWTVRSEEEELEAYKNGFSTVIFENYLPAEATHEAED